MNDDSTKENYSTRRKEFNDSCPTVVNKTGSLRESDNNLGDDTGWQLRKQPLKIEGARRIR